MPAEERIEVGRRGGERSSVNERVSLTRHPQIACSACLDFFTLAVTKFQVSFYALTTIREARQLC